jgi:RNA polymerase sigma-70 factor (ECF subfamily)
MPDNDGLLYIRFQTFGDQKALEAIFNKYKENLVLFIYGFVRNIDIAEELMMDTFAILVSGVARYKETDNAMFKTWLFAIAKNQAFQYLRKQKFWFVSPEKEFLSNVKADDSSLPIVLLLKSERETQLYRLLKTIDVDYRQALYLQYFEDLRPEQISQILKKNIKKTYNLLSRGKEALRDAYEKMGLSWDI